jgi:sugar lactone lactonase YvrE
MGPRLLLVLLFLVLFTGRAAAQSYTFTRFAGTGGGKGSDDAAVPALRLSPTGVAVGSDGTLYVAESLNHTIREIANGVSSTIAGLAGVSGSSDGVGAAARFEFPADVAVDRDGNLYVADRINDTIRKIAAGTRRVTTLAGQAGAFGSADGVGSAARFYSPSSIAIAPDGNLFVADEQNHTIRKITPAGVVTTIAGRAGARGHTDGAGSEARFNSPFGVAVDASGNVWVADGFNNTIRKITPAGVVTTVAGVAESRGTEDGTGASARFGVVLGIAVRNDGTLYVADNNHTIREVDSGAKVRTIAGAPETAGAADGTGSAARFSTPADVEVDAAGNVYVVDAGNFTIRRMTPAGVVTTVAGAPPLTGASNGPRLDATFHFPAAIAFDPAGNLYVADRNNHVIRRINAAGIVSTFAGAVGQRGMQDGNGSAARFNFPLGVATDAAGNVYVADAENDAIRKITPAGSVTTLVATDLWFPAAVAVATNGDVYVADRNQHLIQKITSSGQMTPFAGIRFSFGNRDGAKESALFRNPEGVAVDAAGNVYVADTGNKRVRMISAAGVVTTLAATPQLKAPTSVVVDGGGTVFFSDLMNHTIHRIGTDGVLTTIGGTAGFSGTSDGTGSAARFQFPHGLALDSAGNLYVADRQNYRIRKGSIAIADAAAIDSPTGFTGDTRQLSATGHAATSWQWEIIRRPAGSDAELSSPSSASPTFTPDVPDLYVFRLTASGANGTSITTVSLEASPFPKRRRAARH